MIKMAPRATFVEGTFERMKAKQTKLFKERKQSKTKCKSLKNVKDNFSIFFFEIWITILYFLHALSTRALMVANNLHYHQT